MKCPLCGCVSFYVKDPDDEYETYELADNRMVEGKVNLELGIRNSEIPDVESI